MKIKENEGGNRYTSTMDQWNVQRYAWIPDFVGRRQSFLHWICISITDFIITQAFLLFPACIYLFLPPYPNHGYQSIPWHFGGLSYAFATYHPILISAGHETKMIALGYLPAFIGGLMLIYEKNICGVLHVLLCSLDC